MTRPKAYVFIPPGMAMWQTSLLATELVQGRSFREGSTSFEVVAIARSLDPVTTSAGLRVLPDARVSDCDLADAGVLVIPGCATCGIDQYDEVIEVARRALADSVVVAAIGTATTALANHGMLDAHAHTSCSVQHLRVLAPGYQGAEFHRDDPAVRDGLLVTAHALAPLEFARATLQALDVSSNAALDAWYSLVDGGSDDDYYRLVEEVSGLGR